MFSSGSDVAASASVRAFDGCRGGDGRSVDGGGEWGGVAGEGGGGASGGTGGDDGGEGEAGGG